MLPGLISQQLEIMFRFASSITPILMTTDFQCSRPTFPTSFVFFVRVNSPPRVLEGYWELFLTSFLFIELPHLLAVLSEFSNHTKLPGTVEMFQALITHPPWAHPHSPVQRASLSGWNNDCQTGWTKFCSCLSLSLSLSYTYICMLLCLYIYIHIHFPIMFYAYKYADYNI